jgi:hypothetical protein
LKEAQKEAKRCDPNRVGSTRELTETAFANSCCAFFPLFSCQDSICSRQAAASNKDRFVVNITTLWGFILFPIVSYLQNKSKILLHIQEHHGRRIYSQSFYCVET